MKLVSFLILLLPGFLYSQWIFIGGPVTETQFRGFVVHENYIYTYNYQEILRSSNNGISWEDVSAGLTTWDYKEMLLDGEMLYTGFAHGGFYLFNKQLQKWNLIHDKLRVTALAAKDNLLFAAVPDSGLCISSNHGITWKSTGFPQDEPITGIKVLDEKIIIATYRHLFYTEDNGKNWHQISDNIVQGNVRRFEVWGNKIILGAYKGLFQSDDLGQNWILLDSTMRTAYSISAAGSNILVGTHYGPFLSNNSGNEWIKINSGLGDSIIAASLIYNNQIFGATFYNGLYKLNTLTLTWENNFRGYKPANIFSVAVSNSTKFVSVGPNITAVYKTTDDGESWNKLNTPVFEGIAGLLYHEDKLYFTSNKLLVSSDEGESWDTLSSMINPREIHFAGDTIYFTGGVPPGLFVYSIKNDMLVNIYAGVVNVMAFKGNLLFTGEWMNGVHVSRDKGKTWEDANDGLEYGIFFNDYGVSALMIYGNMVFCSTDKGLFYSDIDTIKWKKISKLVLKNLFVAGEKIIGHISQGILYSNDSGSTWNEERIAYGIYSLTHDDTHLYAGTNMGIWKRAIAELTDVKSEEAANIPQEYILHQNYPNPFNPETTIIYELPDNTEVNVKIFDVLGNEVAILINGEQSAGTYKINWNAAQYPSGIYFYQLKAGKHRQSKKMLLIK